MRVFRAVTSIALLGIVSLVTSCGNTQGGPTQGSVGPTAGQPSAGARSGAQGAGSNSGGASGSPATTTMETSGSGGHAGDGPKDPAGTHDGGDTGDAGEGGGAGAPDDLGANAPLSFAAPVLYRGGAWAMDIGVADLNGDGALDVASADFQHVSAGAFVWLNRGDGTFHAATPYLPGQHATAIEIGDFNGDAFPELLLVGEDDVSVLLNHGDGTFSTPSHLSTGEYGALVLDADGDAKLDFLTASSLFLNDGAASFSVSAGLEVGRPWVATDLNGDGETDVLGGGRDLFVSFGAGGGAFAPRIGYATGATALGSVARGPTVGDANLDGLPDLATAIDNDASASVLLNRGDGTFSAPQVYPTGRWPTAVALGDLNGDGWPELVVANSGLGNSFTERSHYLGVHRNLGDGTFQTQEEFFLVEFPYSVALADVDGDQKLDMVVGNGGGDLRVLLNTGH